MKTEMATTTLSFSLRPHLLCLLLLSSTILAVGKPTKLVDKVCKKTHNYSFCVRSFYSDSRTPEADAYTLAYISVGLAYRNATATQDLINGLLKTVSGHDLSQQQPLERCSKEYSRAVSFIAMADNDLNSETYFELANLSDKAAQCAKDCQSAFKEAPIPPLLAQGNSDLVGLCEILAVTAQLFTGLF